MNPRSGTAAPLQAASALIHHPYQPPAGFDALPPGVFKGSTVFFPNVAALRARQWKDKSGYTYGLHGTPTTFTLEERLASLEGGAHCLLCPSGLSAGTRQGVMRCSRPRPVICATPRSLMW